MEAPLKELEELIIEGDYVNKIAEVFAFVDDMELKDKIIKESWKQKLCNNENKDSD